VLDVLGMGLGQGKIIGQSSQILVGILLNFRLGLFSGNWAKGVMGNARF